MSIADLKALVADNHAVVRAGLRALFSNVAANATVYEADDLDGILAGLAEHEDIDLVVVDLQAGGMDGPAGILRIRAAAPDVPIVVMSAHGRAREVRRAIRAGAAGVIPKSSPPRLVVGALNLVLSGGIYLPPDVLEPDDGPEERRRPGPESTVLASRLTPRQLEVLALLAEGKSNKEIAAVLGLAAGTVKIHVSRIFRALNVRNRTHATIAATRALEGCEEFG